MSDQVAEYQQPDPDRKREIVNRSPLLQMYADDELDFKDLDLKVNEHLDTVGAELLEKKLGHPKFLVQTALLYAADLGHIHTDNLSLEEHETFLASLLVIGYEVGNIDDLHLLHEDIDELMSIQGYLDANESDEVILNQRRLAGIVMRAGVRYKNGELTPTDDLAIPETYGLLDMTPQQMDDLGISPVEEKKPTHTPMPQPFADYIDQAGLLDDFGDKKD